jgi:hypothetical protein
MSRAYRIRVRESLKRVLRAHDRVSTQLELLEILPPEQMAALLEQELLNRGFQKQGDVLVRQQKGGVTVSVDPTSGTVTVQAEALERVELEAEREGRAYDDAGPHARGVKKQLKEELQKSLARKAEEQTARLQSELTDKLEAQLGDLRQELDQAVNRVTADALKQKAAQLGQIKQMTEDPQSGSLTIVLEV